MTILCLQDQNLLSITSLSCEKMGNAADLSELDKGQLGIISEIAWLVGCSHAAAINTYQKWCKVDRTVVHHPTV